MSGQGVTSAPRTDDTAEAAAFAARVAECRARLEGVLERALDQPDPGTARLREAMRYSVLGAGKRLRPTLVYLTGEALGAPLAQLDSAAASQIVIIHGGQVIVNQAVDVYQLDCGGGGIELREGCTESFASQINQCWPQALAGAEHTVAHGLAQPRCPRIGQGERALEHLLDPGATLRNACREGRCFRGIAGAWRACQSLATHSLATHSLSALPAVFSSPGPSNGCTSACPLRFRRISTFCCAAWRRA